ncbi:hypothetical protein VFC49_08795 [Thermococcus sp. SY098]|uniref:hypothetical protein n=1 Tax=Thermococcus sp. SY098 TaxID=3111325 RepID=UPI002D792BCC|nr:hypothetical protein [Thermococcus sp. SY098]WRS52147.1 hypothetical protein VFC49_08795 [Thermococcus sp. SY098]
MKVVTIKVPDWVDENEIKRLVESFISKKRKRITEFAGTWKMDEEEAEKLKKEIRGLWENWKL